MDFQNHNASHCSKLIYRKLGNAEKNCVLLRCSKWSLSFIIFHKHIILSSVSLWQSISPCIHIPWFGVILKCDAPSMVLSLNPLITLCITYIYYLAILLCLVSLVCPLFDWPLSWVDLPRPINTKAKFVDLVLGVVVS